MICAGNTLYEKTAKGYRISKEGGIFLGVPVGTLAYRREYLSKSLDEMTEPFPALDHLHPTASFQLLRLCLNTRASYLNLFRVSISSVSLEILLRSRIFSSRLICWWTKLC